MKFESENKPFFWLKGIWKCFSAIFQLAIIGSDNGLSPGRRQAIIWTIAGILLIGPLGTNFSEILIGIQENAFENVVCKMASICLGLNELMGVPSNGGHKSYSYLPYESSPVIHQTNSLKSETKTLVL